MGVQRASHALEIAGTRAACFAAVSDYDSYPSWQSAVREAVIAERGADYAVVRFTVDLRVRRIHYTLRYHHEPPGRIWWEYVEGDLRSVAGAYTFEDVGGGRTRATYSVEIDPGLFVPGPIKRMLTGQLMKVSVDELRKRVEAEH